MQRMSLSGFCGSAPTSRPKGATGYRGLTVEAVEEQPRLPQALSLLFGRHLDAGRGEHAHRATGVGRAVGRVRRGSRRVVGVALAARIAPGLMMLLVLRVVGVLLVVGEAEIHHGPLPHGRHGREL